ncbi:MAG: DUF559 domain-containing protein [Thermoleophilaceae bacterium]|nr:DUF559 domain-containing protein [Thermoleophilaceae bacterium]
MLGRRQLLELGLSRHTIDRWVCSGRLHRLHRGVYALGHRVISARGRELAAVMACGPGALLSHRSAAVLWAIRRSSASMEVTAPRSAGPRPGIGVHRSRAIAPEDRATCDGIPVTSPARTLVDLADVLSAQRLADVVHEAEVQRIFDLREVGAALERGRGRRGAAKLRKVLRTYEPPQMTRSDAERAFLRLCADHALPSPQSNVLIGPYEVDFLWPEARLVVELDGGATHRTQRAFVNDRRRDRDLAVRGIQVLRVTWWDLAERPRSVAGELRQVLLARC